MEDRRNRGNLDGKTLPLINTDDTDQNGGRRTYRGSGKLPEAPKLPKSPKLEGKTPLINTDDTDQNGGRRTYRGSGKLPEAPKLPKSPKLEGKTPLINTDEEDRVIARDRVIAVIEKQNH